MQRYLPGLITSLAAFFFMVYGVFITANESYSDKSCAELKKELIRIQNYHYSLQADSDYGFFELIYGALFAPKGLSSVGKNNYALIRASEKRQDQILKLKQQKSCNFTESAN